MNNKFKKLQFYICLWKHIERYALCIYLNTEKYEGIEGIEGWGGGWFCIDLHFVRTENTDVDTKLLITCCKYPYYSFVLDAFQFPLGVSSVGVG